MLQTKLKNQETKATKSGVDLHCVSDGTNNPSKFTVKCKNLCKFVKIRHKSIGNSSN